MKNPIIEGLLNEFKEEYPLPTNVSESDAFEHFINYYIIAKDYDESNPDIEDVCTGGAGDKGIDGVGLVVNGNLINSQDDVENFGNLNGYLKVDFIIIQSKYRSNFDSKEILAFARGIKFLFAFDKNFNANSHLNHKKELIEFIYEQNLFKDKNPRCKIYYVTTGKWKNDQEITELIDSIKKELEDKSIFDEVLFAPIDAAGIQNIYRSVNNQMSRTAIYQKFNTELNTHSLWTLCFAEMVSK
ncbi:MAG: hypothetical protein WA865_16305 [Spirulinaceae cyanobacterium]